MNAGGINLEKGLASCSGNNYKFGRGCCKYDSNAKFIFHAGLRARNMLP